MPRFTNRLKHVRVASPCKSDWDQMIGTDRVRFCGQCSLNVYNLSAMTRDEAESFIAGNEGRLCVRFYRRNDGSILTQDCPVGLAAVRARISYWTKAAAAAVLTFLTAIGFENLMSEVHPFDPHWTTGVIAEQFDQVQGGIEPPQSVVGELAAPKPRRLGKRR
jgi:hypothetical protein